jgi:hypothetical protein
MNDLAKWLQRQEGEHRTMLDLAACPESNFVIDVVCAGHIKGLTPLVDAGSVWKVYGAREEEF